METESDGAGREKAHVVAVLDVFGAGAADIFSDVVILGC